MQVILLPTRTAIRWHSNLDAIISYPGKVDNFVSVDGPANVFSLSSQEKF